ncbi:transporter substrate-binding domain-containing protein [Agrobacterium sp. NPDC090273]|uniref:transporter substrate-binding domain-containing protein n=1 Tax=Agrobacterium sp. NPDC090273 TaxID=3363919 RepID=UPI00383B8E19
MTQEMWRIGVILSESGVTKDMELPQRAAIQLAVDEINDRGGVLGRKFEAIFRDPASKPARYGAIAQELCRDERVNVIFGAHMSSSRKAIVPVVEANNALLFYPTTYEGFEYSRNCIYAGAAPNQNSVPLVDYLMEHCGKRIFLVGSDYVYPYASNRIISDLVKNEGGQVVDELYVPLELEQRHIERIIARIRDAKPDAIYSTIVGEGIPEFYSAFYAAGFDPKQTPIASQSTSEVDIALLQPGAAEGHIIAAPFFDSLQTPSAQAFASAMRSRTGGTLPATAPAEAAYYSVHLFATALAIAGDDSIDALLPALYEVEFDAPQGPVRIDRSTNHVLLWPRVARVKEGAPYEIVSAPEERVMPDPYLLDFIKRYDDRLDQEESDLAILG